MTDQRQAPVAVAREVVVRASASRVWAVHTDVNQWPLWHPGVGFSSLTRGLEEGSVIRLRLDGMAVRSRIHEVVPESRISWTLRMFGARGLQQWSLEESSGRTTLRVEEFLEGWAPFFLRGTVRRTVERSREAWLDALRERVEVRGP